jgi:hypothetical protein
VEKTRVNPQFPTTEQIKTLVLRDVQQIFRGWVGPSYRSSQDRATLEIFNEIYLTNYQSYVELAKYFYEAEDKERAEAVMSALFEGLQGIFSQVGLESEIGWVLIDYFIPLGRQSMELGAMGPALSAADAASNSFVPGEEALKAAREVLDIRGEVCRSFGGWFDALERGYEDLTIIQIIELDRHLAPLSEWVALVERIYKVASMHTNFAHFQTSLDYLNYVLSVFEKYPSIREKVGPVMREKIDALKTVNNILMNPDIQNLEDDIEKVNKVFYAAMDSETIQKDERDFYISLLLQISLVACRTGKQKYADETIRLAKASFSSPEEEFMVHGWTARTYIYLAQATNAPASQNLIGDFLPSDDTGEDIKTFNDLFPLTSVLVPHFVAQGKFREAIGVLQNVDQWIEKSRTNDVNQPGYSITELRRSILLQMASIQSAMEGPDVVVNTKKILERAFLLPIESAHIFREIGGSRELKIGNDAVLLEAVHQILNSMPSQNINDNQRLLAFHFISNLNPAGLDQKIAGWTNGKIPKPTRIIVQNEVALAKSRAADGPMAYVTSIPRARAFAAREKFSAVFESIKKEESPQERYRLARRLSKEINFQAAVLALCLEAKEAKEFLDLSFTWTTEIYKSIDSTRIMNRGIQMHSAAITYLLIGGDVHGAMTYAIRLFGGTATISPTRFFIPLFTCVYELVGRIQFVPALAKMTDREFSSFIKQVIEIIKKMLFDSRGHPINSNYFNWGALLIAHLSDILGDSKEAFKFVELAAMTHYNEHPASDRFRARGYLIRAQYILQKIELSLIQRINQGLESVAQARLIPDFDVAHADLIELKLQLLKEKDNPDAIKELCKKAVTLLNDVKESKTKLNNLLAAGLPTVFVEMAYLAGSESVESKELMASMSSLDQWVGGQGDEWLLVAHQYQKSLENRTVFQPTESMNSMRFLSRDGLLPFQMVTAFRSNDPKAAWEFAEAYVKSKNAHIPLNFHLSAVIDGFLNLPLAREVFIHLGTEFIRTFELSETAKKEKAVAKTEVEFLRQVIFILAGLGDVRTIIVLDEALARSDFPSSIREKLIESNGIMAALEKSLEPLDWVKRVEHMRPLSREEAEAIQSRAVGTGWTDMQAFASLALALSRRQLEYSRMEEFSQTFQLAIQDLESLAFSQVRQRLAGIPAEYWQKAHRELDARAASFELIWTDYQTGDYPSALARIQDKDPQSKDAVCIKLRTYLENVQTIERLAQSRLPHQAQEALNAMTLVVLTDQRLRTLSLQVQSHIQDTNQILVDIPKICEQQPLDFVDQMIAKIKRFLELNQESEKMVDLLLDQAKKMGEAGDHKNAKQLLYVIFETTDIFVQSEELDKRWVAHKKKFRTIRRLNRAREMKDWLKVEEDALRTQFEAQEYYAEMSGHEDTLKNKRYLFQAGDWDFHSDGTLTFTKLQVQPIEKSKAPEAAVPIEFSDLNWRKGLSFVITLGEGESAIRIPITFLRMEKRGSQLLFRTDRQGAEQIKKSGQKISGSLVYVKDRQLMNKLTALERTRDYLNQYIYALSDNRDPVNPQPVLDRMLGLDLTNQPSLNGDDVAMDKGIFGYPAQKSAVLAALHSAMRLIGIQGPPGTGKSHTALEIIRLLVKKRGNNPGKIVILSAQAHAAVDKMAGDLQAKNIPIIRSGSEMSKDKISKDFRGIHENRLSLLWEQIQSHHASGQGFVYMATNNGFAGDGECLELLRMYLEGAPMSEIQTQYDIYEHGFEKGIELRRRREASARSNGNGHDRPQEREKIRPVWVQEEAAHAGAAETLVPYYLFNPESAIWLGDQNQLSPHGLDEWAEFVIRKVLKFFAKAVFAIGDPLKVLTPGTRKHIQVSIFEQYYSYLQSWERTYASKKIEFKPGIFFLDIARRGHWFITEFINPYYQYRLKHRHHVYDAQTGELKVLPEDKFEPIAEDTILLIDTPDGTEELVERVSDEFEDIMDDDEYDWEENGGSRPAAKSSPKNKYSSRNFRQAGEVVRTAAYYLNTLSADGNPIQPKDIMILTPYIANRDLINEVLKIVAICSDFAAKDYVSAGEIETVRELINSHLSSPVNQGLITSSNLSRIHDLLTQMKSPKKDSQPALISSLYVLLRPVYDLNFSGHRRISRRDLPNEIEEKKVGEDVDWEEKREKVSLTLDQINSNTMQASTVHPIQGRQNKKVIFATGRSESLGFLEAKKGEPERIAMVAISRAQENVAVITSKDLIPSKLREAMAHISEIHKKFKGVDFPIWDSAPHNLMGGSLRQAWGLSTGFSNLDRDIDVYALPVGETVIFMGVLVYGITQQNVGLIVFGLVIQLFIFPALHVLPRLIGVNNNSYSILPEMGFSMKLMLAYSISSFVLLQLGLSHDTSAWAGLVPMAVVHFQRNRFAVQNSSTLGTVVEDLGKMEKLGLSGINGVSNARQLLEQVPLPISRAPSLRPSRSALRKALSGA